MAYVATLPASWPGLVVRGPVVPRPVYRFRSTHRGLGMTAAQWVGTGGSVASPVVTAAAAPAVAAALGISTSLAVPIVGAAFAGVLFGVEALLNSGCGQTCVVTSEWANQAEPLLQQNIQQYFSLSQRTTVDQLSALNMYDAIWSGLVQRCSQPGLGTAGKNCVADRQAGACKWRASSDSPWPGGPLQGQCFNWFSAYRDPIANDKGVVSVPSAVAAIFFGGGSTGSWLPLALVAGLVGLAFVV